MRFIKFYTIIILEKILLMYISKPVFDLWP